MTTSDETREPMRVEFKDRVEWHLDGQLHREDGPAVEHADGSTAWFRNDVLHRPDGPAIEDAPRSQDSSHEWWVNGRLHRLDGPAIEYLDGTREWWIDGDDLGWTEEEADDWMALTPDQQAFARAHMDDVGAGLTWADWAPLFTTARDTCPAPPAAVRGPAPKRRSTQPRAR